MEAEVMLVQHRVAKIEITPTEYAMCMMAQGVICTTDPTAMDEAIAVHEAVKDRALLAAKDATAVVADSKLTAKHAGTYIIG